MSGARWLGGLALAATLALAAEDTSFLSGAELGQALQTNVVRVRTLDLNEQGFGLVIAASSRHVLIATARHVVLPAAGPAPEGLDPRQRRIEIAFCAGRSEEHTSELQSLV